LNNVIPASVTFAVAVRGTLKNDSFAVQKLWCSNNQFAIGVTYFVRNDPVLGVFFLAEAVARCPITSVFATAAVFKAGWETSNTRTV
jgi:hypothetical protein